MSKDFILRIKKGDLKLEPIKREIKKPIPKIKIKKDERKLR